jgi:hypothetical protein
MSAKIEQIIEIIEEVRVEWRSGGYRSISSLRKKAINIIAVRRDINPKSVRDKPRRKLEPDISYIAEFDRLLEQYLLK